MNGEKVVIFSFLIALPTLNLMSIGPFRRLWLAVRLIVDDHRVSSSRRCHIQGRGMLFMARLMTSDCKRRIGGPEAKVVKAEEDTTKKSSITVISKAENSAVEALLGNELRSLSSHQDSEAVPCSAR